MRGLRHLFSYEPQQTVIHRLDARLNTVAFNHDGDAHADIAIARFDELLELSLLRRRA